MWKDTYEYESEDDIGENLGEKDHGEEEQQAAEAAAAAEGGEKKEGEAGKEGEKK